MPLAYPGRLAKMASESFLQAEDGPYWQVVWQLQRRQMSPASIGSKQRPALAMQENGLAALAWALAEARFWLWLAL